MESVSPVLTENEIEAERVIALDQPEYFPIVICRVVYRDKDENQTGVATLTRYRFTEEERRLVASGCDIIIGQPHHGPVMPVSIQFAKPESYPVAD